ncbi:MAG TPA: hypothetical protein VFQ40_00915, partial [Actinomycetota bacterium]|nr:hypothetical protein [Actinomycetota bacterium]
CQAMPVLRYAHSGEAERDGVLMVDRGVRGADPRRLVFAVALCAGLAVVLLASAQRSTPHVLPSSGRPFMDLFDPTLPLMPADGVRTTLGDAAAKASFPVYMPAAVGEPTQVWTADLGDGDVEVGMRFGKDLVVVLDAWPAGKDAAESLAARTESFGTGFTTTLGGHPARVRAYDAAKGEVPVNAVFVVTGGVEVQLFGTMDISSLVRLASDLRA